MKIVIFSIVLIVVICGVSGQLGLGVSTNSAQNGGGGGGNGNFKYSGSGQQSGVGANVKPGLTIGFGFNSGARSTNNVQPSVKNNAGSQSTLLNPRALQGTQVDDSNNVNNNIENGGNSNIGSDINVEPVVNSETDTNLVCDILCKYLIFCQKWCYQLYFTAFIIFQFQDNNVNAGSSSKKHVK